MSLTKINFGRTPLANIQWNGDISDLLDLLVEHLTGALDNGAFTGQIGGSAPTSDIGLWLNGNTIYNWSATDGRYLPLPIITGSLFGGNLYTTQLISRAATASITLNLPDQNGKTLATTDDIRLAGTTQTQAAVSGGSVSFDWSAILNGGSLYVTLSGANGAVTIAEANAPSDAEFANIWIEQSASGSATPFTITWPSLWQVSTSAVLTNRGVSSRVIDHFVVYRVGSQTFVEQRQTFGVATTGGGSDTTPPVVSSIDNSAGSDVIEITFNESLQGKTLDSTKWSVKKNGVTNAVSSAVANGNLVLLTVAATYKTSNTGTVQYSGTDVKDIAGNAAASFGPSAITISGDFGGGGGGGGALGP